MIGSYSSLCDWLQSLSDFATSFKVAATLRLVTGRKTPLTISVRLSSWTFLMNIPVIWTFHINVNNLSLILFWSCDLIFAMLMILCVPAFSARSSHVFPVPLIYKHSSLLSLIVCNLNIDIQYFVQTSILYYL